MYSPHVWVISGFHGYAVCHWEYNLQHLFSGTFRQSAHIHTSSAHLAWNTKPLSSWPLPPLLHTRSALEGMTYAQGQGPIAMVVSKRHCVSWTDSPFNRRGHSWRHQMQNARRASRLKTNRQAESHGKLKLLNHKPADRQLPLACMIKHKSLFNHKPIVS